jgi:hypothetical protein
MSEPILVKPEGASRLSYRHTCTRLCIAKMRSWWYGMDSSGSGNERIVLSSGMWRRAVPLTSILFPSKVLLPSSGSKSNQVCLRSASCWLLPWLLFGDVTLVSHYRTTRRHIPEGVLFIVTVVRTNRVKSLRVPQNAWVPWLAEWPLASLYAVSVSVGKFRFWLQTSATLPTVRKQKCVHHR